MGLATSTHAPSSDRLRTVQSMTEDPVEDDFAAEQCGAALQ
jgi:hypothetical protein